MWRKFGENSENMLCLKHSSSFMSLTPPAPHPDSFIDHYSHTGVGRIWPFPDRLFIVTALSNPLRWRARYHNYWKFAKHMEDSGVNLITVELAYFGYIDADFTFTRPDWAQETLHQLQHYDAVQPYSSFSDLDSNHRCGRPMPSFCWNYIQGNCIPPGQYGSRAVGAVGGAWCFRTEAFNAIGGLLDTCILGSGDWHMAMGLAQRQDSNLKHLRSDSQYVKSIRDWQRNASVLKQNIGAVDCHAIHHWHGPKTLRNYVGRYKILVDYDYDPLTDIKRDWQGVYQLTGNKPRLRDALRAYSRSRHEDDPTPEGGR